MRILVVEDQKDIQNFIRKTLESERYVIDIVDDGEKGVWQAKINPYDLIILDYMMPKKNGIEVARELRAAQIQTPIIMLTVVAAIANKVKALDVGIDDYLTKPFHTKELTARVRALLRRKKNMQPTGKIKVGELELNPAKFEVKRGDKKIALSRKEYILLEYFIRNPGRAISRTELLEHVWDTNADPLTNTVDVHVRFLRNKIDKGFTKPLLKTVHGVGYMLDDGLRKNEFLKKSS
ncbi:response regulator transcription factor [Patescibacteria group bacterium]